MKNLVFILASLVAVNVQADCDPVANVKSTFVVRRAESLDIKCRNNGKEVAQRIKGYCSLDLKNPKTSKVHRTIFKGENCDLKTDSQVTADLSFLCCDIPIRSSCGDIAGYKTQENIEGLACASGSKWLAAKLNILTEKTSAGEK